MKNIFFLALHVTAVSISHISIIAFFSYTFLYYTIATKALLR